MSSDETATVEQEEASAAASIAAAENATALEPAVSAALEALLAAARDEARGQPRPSATYRLQFHREFTFADATRIIPYLARLGVTYVYASPYLRARAGSQHGYDIVDHSSLNPELGTPDDYERLVAALREHQMHHILDVVPNHMSVGSSDNGWWQDVLEHGPASRYAGHFDIDWRPLKPDLINKVLLPVLGEQFGRVLEEGQLQLRYEYGALAIHYYERIFPVAPKTWALVLGERSEELQSQLGEEHPAVLEYQSILRAIHHLPGRDETDPEKQLERYREREVIQRRLARLCEESPEIEQFIQQNVTLFNGVSGDPRSFDKLYELLLEQPYRLSFWRVASDEINYRRFFDVNELAALCVERPEVFEDMHALVFRLLKEGKLSGLRIDHADGLFDPTAYLWNLQERFYLILCRRAYDRLYSAGVESGGGSENGGAALAWEDFEPLLRDHFTHYRASQGDDPLATPLYLVVEKILEGHERLPSDWPVYGTTGYDFLNHVNGLFVDNDHAKTLDAVYSKFVGERVNFEELVYDCKKLIMDASMASELHVLGHRLDRISELNRWSRDFTESNLTDALREFVACFPVYRTYVGPEGLVAERDRKYIDQAIARAKRRNPATNQPVFDFLSEVLLLNPDHIDEEQRQLRIAFVMRLQQFTGPVMAKSVEDTAYYRFNRLVSLNEVGGNPQEVGQSVAAFHQQNRVRRTYRPLGMLATSTHDSKRSEDVRARINVLSEIPQMWRANVFQWTRWNQRKKTKVDNELAPSRNDEYLLYQTLVGSWPTTSPVGAELDEYRERISNYMIKAMRESKQHTSWIAPYEPYEQATRDFIEALLSAEPASAFRTHFEPFAHQIARVGWWNSLSQKLLHLTSPGVPDLYQGTETLDFSLVDPDNRRPVDYAARERALRELDSGGDAAATAEAIAGMMASPEDGRLKLYLVSRVLRLRREHPELFTAGEYVPLEVQGLKERHVCAFARIDGPRVAITIAPRLIATLLDDLILTPIGAVIWGDTRVVLPPELRTAYRDQLTGQEQGVGDSLSLEACLSRLPVALLLGIMG